MFKIRKRVFKWENQFNFFGTKTLTTTVDYHHKMNKKIKKVCLVFLRTVEMKRISFSVSMNKFGHRVNRQLTHSRLLSISSLKELRGRLMDANEKVFHFSIPILLFCQTLFHCFVQ